MVIIRNERNKMNKKEQENSIPKISIDEQIQLKFDCIGGDFKKLESNQNLSLAISTIKNALFHINGILKNISSEITEIQKRVVNIPKAPIL